MKRIRSRPKQLKTQTFVHMATYRFSEVFPGGLGGRTHQALVQCVLTAVEDACRYHGWQLLAWDAFPERVEVLLSGSETRGETGEGVAAALDSRVYAATGARAAAH
ncbi:MAG: hypothetical protein ABIK09_12080 [Pseudomonadota bacterium]